MQDEQRWSANTQISPLILPLDPTGIPNLDLVLGGGLVRGTLLIVMGPPGCGKTTLAAQLAFTAARANRRTLILTSLSESISKLLAHLSNYDFYDSDLIGDRVQVLSLQQFLPAGLASTATEVVSLVREGGFSLVALDGFSGVRVYDPDARAGRQFLFDVGTTLSLHGATTVVTTEADVRDPSLFPEATTADTILGLHFTVHNERQRRRIEVVKARGAAPLPGLHSMAITAAGLRVFPRLEARIVGAAAAYADREPASVSPEAHEDAPRALFGLPALDALLGGGITRATTTMVIGSGGTGKTLLGLQFALAGVAAGEPVVFMGFHEDRRQLLLKADAFNMGQELRAALAPGGGLTLLHQAPVELDVDAVADKLLATLDHTQARRLVVDSIAVLERSVSEGSTVQRVQNFLAAVIAALQERQITALFTRETGPFAGTELELETDLSSGVAENVLWLQGVIYRDRFYRVLSVLKMRYSAHDLTLREFTISAPAGIEVLAPFESERRVLAGIAHEHTDPLASSADRTISNRARTRRAKAPQSASQDPVENA
jgi:circadian clock protein KaiC